jgi:hypothetical protein
LSPLYVAFKRNEATLTQAIQFAAEKSAAAMGSEFNKVYHRSYCSGLTKTQKKAA